MRKHFYSHIVEIDSLLVELEELDLKDREKHHLRELIESNLHHAILDAILSELTEADKKKFLEHVAHDDHDKIWQHLHEKIDRIEEKIKKAADDLTKELRKDIHEAKAAKS